MVVPTWDSEAEIWAPPKKLMEKIQPQIEHARWHGWKLIRWRVGILALDEFAMGHGTENVRKLLGTPVEVDPKLGRYDIILEI